MPRDQNVPQIDPEAKQILSVIQALVDKHVGPDATFEARQRARFELMGKVMWAGEDADLQGLKTDAEFIEVEGKIYRRLNQDSSATYHGLWGTHLVEEALYRDTTVRGGPTIKPIECRAGIIRGMLPEAARVAGRLLASMPRREVEVTLREMGYRPPSRAFIEKRVGEMAGEFGERVAELEAATPPVLPDTAVVAGVSCGMDRVAVRMSEPLATGELKNSRRRTAPYKRMPPPPTENNWRMAWVGSVTLYAADGESLRTLRYFATADEVSRVFAARIVADVKSILEKYPGIPVVNLQDAAGDLRTLPEQLQNISANSPFYPRIDIHHLLTYLDKVVSTCELAGDPDHMKIWYRQMLMNEDDGIDRIFRGLRRIAKTIPKSNSEGRKAVADAIRYIRNRRPAMRYAHLVAANLPVGSGATESTCALMQLRIKRPGMSWEPEGLRGIATLRTLVLSDRWLPAWEVYAATHRREVHAA